MELPTDGSCSAIRCLSGSELAFSGQRAESSLAVTRAFSHFRIAREILLFPIEQLPVLRSYPEFEDVAEDRPISIYSLNEIATEKIVALQDRARNEPRDLYDLWFLTSHAGVEIGNLIGAITEKLRFREKGTTGVEDRIIAKEARLKALWNGRLGHQMDALPQYDEIFRIVRRELRQAAFPS